MARQPEALADLAERGVSVRPGAYFEPDSLEQVLQGVDKLLLALAMAFTDVKTAHR
jgi:NAD(P)H dehydrogenase (quinone)